MKIGAQLFTINAYTRTPAEIEASLRRIKALGFDVIQISGFGPCDPDLLAAWVKELQFDVCVTHVPWARLADPGELKKLIGEHKKLGCSHIGLGGGPADLSYEAYTQFIKKVREICKQVGDEGIIFGFHNHDGEFEKWNGITALDRLFNECPDLYFILDTFWVQAGGANPADYIRKFKDRIRVIHFKDYRMKGRVRRFAEIGQGNLNWDVIIPLCVEQNIPYAVIEQDNDYMVDPFESLVMSRDFLTQKMKGS
jgi:sugar phosphate isomerase/epimerase